MTRVCLVGADDVDLRFELLSRETAREALSTYDLTRPYANAIALSTVSVGAAVSLCNDLNWYLVRFVDEAWIGEPSISDEEWLSRDLATAVRNDGVRGDETDEYLKIYGVIEPEPERAAPEAGAAGAGGGRSTARADPSDSPPPDADGGGSDGPGSETSGSDGTVPDGPRLVEPLYVRRTDGSLPEYDLRDVDDTVVVRVTEEEFAT